ncbi:MAG: acetyl-CoA C-acetyltransferase [Bdellovibrionaceae bacterium]|nr:acetyl-CoA C-acetyltransferase [Pseudobdellovibrionaceae bacterium]
MKKAAILGSSRIPFVKSMTKYMSINNQELMTEVLKNLVHEYNLRNKRLGEVVVGAVMKHSKDWNLARECTIGSGLSPETPANDLQQACGTSLEATINISNKIKLGQIESGIAGGTDTNSDLPIVYGKAFTNLVLESYRGRSGWEKAKPFLKLRPKHFIPVFPGVIEPRTGLSMGQSCEVMAKEWKVSREEQDQIASESHQKAAKAYDENFYLDLITSFKGSNRDGILRPDTTLEQLAKLKPAFDRKSGKGTLTAGNSTALTDGAAAVLLGSEEWAKENGLEVQAYFVDGEVAAVDYIKSEGLLMAPAYAVPRLLARNGLSLQDFDFYEIHEAFAAQLLCTLKAWESEKFCKEKLGLTKAMGSIDRNKMNVKGGSLAMGHPFAATGARIVGGLAKMLKQKGSGRGLISICTAGGMGVTAIIER